MDLVTVLRYNTIPGYSTVTTLFQDVFFTTSIGVE